MPGLIRVLIAFVVMIVATLLDKKKTGDESDDKL